MTSLYQVLIKNQLHAFVLAVFWLCFLISFHCISFLLQNLCTCYVATFFYQHSSEIQVKIFCSVLEPAKVLSTCSSCLAWSGLCFSWIYVNQLESNLCLIIIIILINKASAAKGGKSESFAPSGLDYTDISNAQIRKVCFNSEDCWQDFGWCYLACSVLTSVLFRLLRTASWPRKQPSHITTWQLTHGSIILSSMFFQARFCKTCNGSL